jgi:protein tyrosine phosphatase
MDNSDNYPVLIHCYHGTGRAEMYSALYRIEYEKFTNEAHVKEWEHYWNLVLLMMEHLKENT